MHLAVSVVESDKRLNLWLDYKSCQKVWLGYSKEDWYYNTVSKGKCNNVHRSAF